MNISESMQARAEEFVKRYGAVREQLGRVIVGHDDIVHGVLTCLFVGGHCLLEGVPGLGKTLLVRSLAQTLDLKFSRIQFTPDLMPADILGTNMVMETADGRRVFEFQKGPLFTQICLADEINRATPKTQSAMLETMQEGTITVAGTRYQLDKPFFVMATQNPIEQEGTYPLPEAQLDRFMFQVDVDYPSDQEEIDIVKQQTSPQRSELRRVLSPERILELQELVLRVPAADHVVRYAVALARATRPAAGAPDFVREYVSWGAGPRASQYLVLAGKARAILDGRFAVSTDDVKALARPTLEHRLIVNYKAEAEGVTASALVERLLDAVKP
jgi:MoxR-like ATPase